MVRTLKKRKKFVIWGFFIAVLLLGGGVWVFAVTTVPDFDSFSQRKIIQSTKIYDRDGELLYDVHGDIKRTVIPFDKIPRYAKNATLVIEDQNFYRHFGVSPTGIIRAFLVNLAAGETRQGGSTITQQLVKHTFLTPEKTLVRKIKEVVLALKVETRYSKDEILNFYLNEVPYGASAYGIEAASQTYFGKPAQELTLSESAYLAAMLKAPTRYSPYGSRQDELESRKNLVLERMREENFITSEEYEKAKKEEVRFIGRGASRGIKAPHFSLFVKEYLVEKYGEDVVEQGGLKVTTTLNLAWQEKIEKLVKNFSESNEKNFNAFNAGLTAIDPKTGQILVMVGSRDYFENPRPEGCVPGLNCKFDPEVNMALRARQPGSAFKPFVYLTAFKKGYTPDTAVFDLPTEFSPSCNPDGTPGPGVDPERCYHPQNYDEKFRGPISLREALAQSVNVPSVKVLYLAGLLDSLKLAREFGITTLNEPERYGLTLVLGGGEVRLLEMISAYGAFGNEGVLNPYTPILKIEDGRGNILEEYEKREMAVLEPNIALMISDVLSDNKARAPAFGESSALYFPERPVAVKTGTTNDYRDAWVVGYTPNIALGVWAGNNDNTPMEKRVAGFIAAPLWHAALEEIFKELPREDFKAPKIHRPEKPILRGEWRGGKVYKIDKISKKLATEFTPEELIEERVVAEVHSILYWVDKNNPLGEVPQNPDNDPQFKNWESQVRAWVTSQGIKEGGGGSIPNDFDDLHRPEFYPEAEIILNPSQENFSSGSKIKIAVVARGKFPIEQVDIFSNSEYIGSASAPPFEFPITASGLPGEEIRITAQVYDQVRNKTVVERVIRIF